MSVWFFDQESNINSSNVHQIAILLKTVHNKTAGKSEYLTSSKTWQGSRWVIELRMMLTRYLRSQQQEDTFRDHTGPPGGQLFTWRTPCTQKRGAHYGPRVPGHKRRRAMTFIQDFRPMSRSWDSSSQLGKGVSWRLRVVLHFTDLFWDPTLTPSLHNRIMKSKDIKSAPHTFRLSVITIQARAPSPAPSVPRVNMDPWTGARGSQLCCGGCRWDEGKHKTLHICTILRSSVVSWPWWFLQEERIHDEKELI